jgi:hypothetical protein
MRTLRVLRAPYAVRVSERRSTTGASNGNRGEPGTALRASDPRLQSAARYVRDGTDRGANARAHRSREGSAQ